MIKRIRYRVLRYMVYGLRSKLRSGFIDTHETLHEKRTKAKYKEEKYIR